MRNLMLLISILSLLLALRYIQFFASKIYYTNGQQITLTHTFLEEPKRYITYQLFIVDELTVKLPRFPTYSYGTSVELKGKISIKKNEKGKEMISLVFPRVQIVKTRFTPILSFIGGIRDQVIDTFTKSLGRDEGGLLLGIVFGIKNQLSQEFLDKLQTTGMLHVVAASGMNVTLLSQVFLGIAILFMNRYMAITVTICMLVVYVLISGAESSILRAAIMGSIAFSAQLFGRQNISLFALLLAAFLILIIHPPTAFDVGFQLSFAATLGILYYKPLFDHIFSRLVSYFRDDLSTSLSAQALTMPIILGTFSSVSLISVVVNMLILWMVPILMIGGGVAAVTSLLSPVLAVPFIYLTLPLLLLFKFIVEVFSKLPLLIHVSSLPIAILIGYYFLLLSLLLLGRKYTKRHV